MSGIEKAPKEAKHPNQDKIGDEVFTAPNLVTFARILLIPVFIFLLLDRYDIWAGALFTFIAATDFVDGKLARRYGAVTKLGTMLDPVADRLLILSAAICIIIRGDIMPLWLIVILVVREVLTAVWAVSLKALGTQLVVRFIGKWQATLVFTTLPFFIWARGFSYARDGVATSGGMATTGDVFLVLAYAFGISGAILGYWTLGYYLVDGVRARRDLKSSTNGD